MSTRAAAQSAIEKMDNTELDGRTIRVNESRPKGSSATPRGPGGAGGFNVQGREEVKLYVGNLSFNTVEADIRREFEKYGAVKDCFMPTDRDTGKLRGFCFVTSKFQSSFFKSKWFAQMQNSPENLLSCDSAFGGRGGGLRKDEWRGN